MALHDIAILRKQRGIIKSACTRTKNYVDGIVDCTPDVIAQVEERKSKLENYWLEYNAIQLQIETIDENDADRELFETAYYGLSARMRTIICPNLVPARGRLSAAPSPSNTNRTDAEDPIAHVRLPKLTLPNFSGKYEDWVPFHNVYNSVIHENTALTVMQKFQYLRTAITGDAAGVIESLELSDENYGVAWKLLQERYNNTRVIVQTHIRKIMELPVMSRESLLELRQIADGTAKHVRALTSLKRPADKWDDLLVYIITAKLDTVTVREWHNSLAGTELPTLHELLTFLQHRCQMLETNLKKTPAPAPVSQNRQQATSYRHSSTHVATVNSKCAYCRGDHRIYTCSDFLKLPTEKRIAQVRRQRLCINCLRPSNHTISQCSSRACQICNVKHNTLLHLSSKKEEDPIATTSQGSTVAQSRVTSNSAVASKSNNVMLSTAVIHAHDSTGAPKRCRVLLDSGSQANFISQELVSRLKLKSRATNISITGINQTATTAYRVVSVKIESRDNSFSTTIDCIVTNRITERFPITSFNRDEISIPHNIRLADPRFNESSEIDMLIGADLFWQLLCVGQIKPSANHPTLQKTRFGWVLAGRCISNDSISRSVRSCHIAITDEQLHGQLRDFWRVEEVEFESAPYSPDERICESHFRRTTTRDSSGRFVVHLPVKENVLHAIGDVGSVALRRFRSLERRLDRDEVLKTQYAGFMREYLELGHMRRVENRDSANNDPAFYLPHHAVYKESSSTTKLRVVFDGSCKGPSGLSLNDALMVGPVVQQDLLSIILRFRTLIYVFCADIVKMYRQILVHESQTRLQRIFWRDSSSGSVDTYELTTVTYGTSSAPYLATRCLNYLAELESRDFPLGAKHILRDFYVDDCLSGADTVAEAKAIRDQIVAVLEKGQFTLSKWASNEPQLLEIDHSSDTLSSQPQLIDLNKECDSRILGIRWNPVTDSLHFRVERSLSGERITKRSILSEISKLFDPLGLIGPIIMIAKMIIQELWQAKINWDESVPTSIHSRWSHLTDQLTCLNQLQIPRLTKFSNTRHDQQVHGFCDASQAAYGACIYIRSRGADGDYRVELLCSKSRVAPLKAVSLPRLELCAAVLLTQLFDKVRKSIDLEHMQRFFWSDSTIVLHWISSCSRKWSVFVANRVGEIQRVTCAADWRHVATQDNPADILSRGAEPAVLLDSQIWWHGPDFLQGDETAWPEFGVKLDSIEMPEQLKRTLVHVAIEENSTIRRLLDSRSSLQKICRIIGYCLRFCKRQRLTAGITEPLGGGDTALALLALCRFVQGETYAAEVKLLADKKPLERSNNLLSLSPFLDTDGLIRVGGRLRNSTLAYSARYPILLPKSHRLTNLIIEHEHRRNLHAGVQGTIAAVRQRFWPLSLRSTTRKIVRECITCFKNNPEQSEAIMSSLPAPRVTPSRPFSHCGVDYAGPITIREGKRRNARNVKAYIAIFVCFVTKAVHIEIVGDLTTDSFIGTLKRFISRRGKIISLHSDNGTAFTGAARELKELHEFLAQTNIKSIIRDFLQESQISWHFIPPNAPHFGGLWEAAVKSAKFHMHRLMGNAHLTYEEVQTLFCEIEAILNSRPITPVSEDPNDMGCLTPGHFLIGEELNSFPREDLSSLNENRLSRWQRVEQLRQHFWSRWSREYLSQLQEKSKWRTNKGTQLQLGQLVLVKQQGLAPLQWIMGRVQEIHPGPDEVVRAASIKTLRGVITRPLAKLAILPIRT